MCCTKWSLVINLIYSGQQSFSYKFDKKCFCYNSFTIPCPYLKTSKTTGTDQDLVLCSFVTWKTDFKILCSNLPQDRPIFIQIVIGLRRTEPEVQVSKKKWTLLKMFRLKYYFLLISSCLKINALFKFIFVHPKCEKLTLKVFFKLKVYIL